MGIAAVRSEQSLSVIGTAAISESRSVLMNSETCNCPICLFPSRRITIIKDKYMISVLTIEFNIIPSAFVFYKYKKNPKKNTKKREKGIDKEGEV